jgi:hypothetical protein
MFGLVYNDQLWLQQVALSLLAIHDVGGGGGGEGGGLVKSNGIKCYFVNIYPIWLLIALDKYDVKVIDFKSYADFLSVKYDVMAKYITTARTCNTILSPKRNPSRCHFLSISEVALNI